MHITRLEDRVSVVAGISEVADLADVWLVDALASLLDACAVPEADRRSLVESGADTPDPELTDGSAAEGDPVRLARLDASRRALVFAALAVEARLNRVLRHCDAAELQAVAHLAPGEKFRLAPRLLDELECAAKDAALCDLVAQLFNARDELVGAGTSPGVAPPDGARMTPSRIRAMVEASAKICCFLGSLAGEEELGAAPQVRRATVALARRAYLLSVPRPPGTTLHDLDSNGFGDFPPDVGGS